MRPTFTFAIVNWNTRALLRQCLSSIEKERAGYDIQLLVADNASTDGSVEMVKSEFPRATLVVNLQNLGFAGGHKALFERSRGAYHVLVNSDVRFLPGCLQRWEACMLADEQIAVLGCQILGAEGTVQPSCRRFPSLCFQLLEASGMSRLFPRSALLNAYRMGDFDHCTSRVVDQVMGSLFLIRGNLLSEVGHLDTGFFMYYEEVDYCKRCYSAGYKVYFDADSRVYHEGGGSSRQVKELTIRRSMRSMRLFFKKHYGSWTLLPLLAILSLDAVTHFVHGLFTDKAALTTLRAYGLGCWDVLSLKRADL